MRVDDEPSRVDDDPDCADAQTLGVRRRVGGRPGRVVVVLAVGLLAALLVRALVIEAFFVPSPGMSPTVAAGDRVLVVKPVGAPGRGDVVVADVSDAFSGPSRATPQDEGIIGGVLGSVATALGVRNGSRSVISRVVAVEGDRVEVASGTLTIDGNRVRRVFEPDVAAFTVPPGHVWLLGDNHPLAIDSLSNAASTPGHGVVPESDVVGLVWLRYWPLSRFGVLEPSGEGPDGRGPTSTRHGAGGTVHAKACCGPAGTEGSIGSHESDGRVGPGECVRSVSPDGSVEGCGSSGSVRG